MKTNRQFSQPGGECRRSKIDSRAWRARAAWLALAIVSVLPTPSSGDRTPEGFKLDQKYPNPFNGRTTIRYSVVHDGLVELVLFDMAGQPVATLTSGNRV